MAAQLEIGRQGAPNSSESTANAMATIFWILAASAVGAGANGPRGLRSAAPGDVPTAYRIQGGYRPSGPSSPLAAGGSGGVPQVVGFSTQVLDEAGPSRRVVKKRRRRFLPYGALAAGTLVALPLSASAAGVSFDVDVAAAVPGGRDLACSAAAAVGAVGWLRANTWAASEGLVGATLSRKLIHIGSAPLFVLAWRFYGQSPSAAVAAALVPAFNVVKIVSAARRAETAKGRGLESSETEFVDAVSRTGDPREVLGGPLLYTCVLFLCTLVGFRSTPAVVALSQMAVGDGLADVAGRRFGKNNKWFCNADKSYAGSLAFVAGATVASLGLLAWLGLVDSPFSPDLVGRVGLVSLACAVAEVLPALAWADDNLSVPVVGALLAALLLPP